METTVTGMFASQELAKAAIEQLAAAGFREPAVCLVTAETPHRHEIVAEETADAARGTLGGFVVGGIGGAIAGAVLAPAFSAHWGLGAVVGAVAAAGVGGLLGYGIGALTGHQVQEEYESRLEGGAVMVAVNTDHAHAAKAREVLATAGGTDLSDSVHRRHHGAPVSQTG
jgi:hypothetical protein